MTVKDRYESIPENIRAIIYETHHAEADQSIVDIFDEIIEGEIVSPVEQIFYAHWAHYIRGAEHIELWPQSKVGKYFVDFTVGVLDYFLNQTFLSQDVLEEISKECPLIAVEIDGHQWHEKTKEQAAKDKKRERFIVSNGYQVMRFTGSEILKNSIECCEQVLSLVEPSLKKLKIKYKKQIIDAHIAHLGRLKNGVD